MAAVTEPARGPRRSADVVGPVARSDRAMAGPVPTLARHSFELANGHRVGLVVSGRGVPLVVVHGFTAEGFLYADTLRRLVATGFKVVAVDMAGHGGTQGLPLSGGHLGDYAALMAPGARRAGHPPGGDRRPLDGRSGHGPAGRQPARADHRRAADRRHRGRPVGPHGQPVPAPAAAAGPAWARRCSSTRCRPCPLVRDPTPGRPAGPAAVAHRGQPRHPSRGGWWARRRRSCAPGAAGGSSTSWRCRRCPPSCSMATGT